MIRPMSLTICTLALVVVGCAAPEEATPMAEKQPKEADAPVLSSAPVANDAGVVEAAPPAAGPAPCVLDTHAVVTEGSRLVTTVTSRGRHFAFEPNGAPWASNGRDLTSFPHYAGGPCAGKAPGECKLDTRAFLVVDGRVVETITAYGKLYHFEGERPGATNGADLMTIARFAKGPCAGKGSGTCTLDTRLFVSVNGLVVESITAYGRLWNFDAAGNPSVDSGRDLTTVPQYAAGPCKGAAGGTCRFDTRAFVVENGTVLEVVTRGGKVWRWIASGPAAGSEVQPSGVPTEQVGPWHKSACQ